MVLLPLPLSPDSTMVFGFKDFRQEPEENKLAKLLNDYQPTTVTESY
jgi:hypothetical protein